MYMNHATYFKELADYYNNSRVEPNDSMRRVSDLRREYNDQVIDTLFSEDLLRGLLAGKACRLTILMNPWWWWATYQIP
jgi:hypothetical protein